MSTKFPGSVQTFIPHAATDSMSTQEHHALHDDLADTVQAVEMRAILVRHLTDFGILADGTDQTSVVNAYLSGLDPATKGVLLAPYNCKFDPGSVVKNLPPGVVLLDLSSINSFAGAGETTKRVGILSGDTAVSDTQWAVESGHHPAIALNNHGTAGTTSAGLRLASYLWACGRFATGSTNKRGWRGGALESYRKSASGDFWERVVRTLAPWVAINANYERWATGVAATSGATYVTNNNTLYVAASTGITGVTAPSHTSGTESDGGVKWMFVDSGDRTLQSIDEYGRFKLSGGNGLTDLMSLRQSIVDTATTAILRVTPRGATRGSRLVLESTNGASTVVAVPYLEATDTGGLRVRNSTGGTNLAHFSDAGGLQVQEFRMGHTTAANLDTTPSVNGFSTVFLSNTGATSITSLDDGSDNQVVRLIATTANTTLVHSTTLMLSGSVNQVLTAWSSVTFQKVPSAISNRWIEVARSLK